MTAAVMPHDVSYGLKADLAKMGPNVCFVPDADIASTILIAQ